jgi:hypothetical protein
MMCGGNRHKRKPVVVTEKRLNNFLQAFDWAKWDKSSIKIVRKGIGDKPQWSIEGKFKKFNLLWTSAHPGGAEPYLKVFDKKGNLLQRYSKATFQSSSLWCEYLEYYSM